MLDQNKFNQLAQRRSADNRKYLQRVRLRNPRNLDDVFHRLHDDVFEETNCLACANCCKTTSPIFYQVDIERIARAMRMKPGAFVEKYLRVDEDNDFVLKSSPCPFLDGENYCTIYEDRPKACREYPHTNRKKMIQITELTYKNTMVCPAVLEIVERLKRVLPAL